MFYIVGLALLAGGLSAIDLSPIYAAFRQADYAGTIALCEQNMATAKNNFEKRSVIAYRIYSQIRLRKLTTSAAALSEFDRLASSVGFTGNTDSVRVMIFELCGEHLQAAEAGKNSSDPGARYRAALNLGKLQRFEEAAALAAGTNLSHGYYTAVNFAKKAKLPEKVYEYALAGLNAGKLTDPASVRRVVNYMLDTDFTGTAISDAKIKVFLQTVNRRCSRYLKPGVVTGWDETIQLVRQTLEAF